MNRILTKSAIDRLRQYLKSHGYGFVEQSHHEMKVAESLGLHPYVDSYGGFDIDHHLNADEGARRRRYGRFLLRPRSGELRVYAHDTFFQSAHFDELYGDIHRSFAPLTRAQLENTFFKQLLLEDFSHFPIPESQLDLDWEVSAHLIRIMAVPGNDKGRPAPEGIHQDGYHFGVARLFRRENLEGAESRIHRLDKEMIDRKLLRKPLDALYMNDRAIFHSVEPFQAVNPKQPAIRDMLISLYQPVVESPQRHRESFPLTSGGIAMYENSIFDDKRINETITNLRL